MKTREYMVWLFIFSLLLMFVLGLMAVESKRAKHAYDAGYRSGYAAGVTNASPGPAGEADGGFKSQDYPYADPTGTKPGFITNIANEPWRQPIPTNIPAVDIEAILNQTDREMDAWASNHWEGPDLVIPEPKSPFDLPLPR